MKFVGKIILVFGIKKKIENKEKYFQILDLKIFS